MSPCNPKGSLKPFLQIDGADFCNRHYSLCLIKLCNLGKIGKADNRKALKVLDWKPITNRDVVTACAESLIDLKLVNKLY